MNPAGASDLLAAAAGLVDIASVSHHETALADHIEDQLRSTAPHLEVTRIGDNVVARTLAGGETGGSEADGSAGGRRLRLLLAGHLDTVPANGNATARIEGDTLWGLGSADMKGDLAVMLDLAASSELVGAAAVDLTWVFYVGEEVARSHNGLLQITAARPDLMAADAAILGEPTGAVVEAGCQGALRMVVTLAGTRAHPARPWMGVNAIHRLGALLNRVGAYEGRRPVIDGCEFREALQAVKVEGGVAGNVVPDRASVTLNHRFAPDRQANQAFTAMCAFLGDNVLGRLGDEVELIEAAPAAAPGLEHPLLAGLVRRTGVPARAKLGWTDVAYFAERGIPATNFGPGDPSVAHTAEERVDRADLEQVSALLRSLIVEGGV